MGKSYYIGCDVGTGSARAGIFDETGRMLAMETHNIKMWKPKTDFVEQSSQDIWQACCISIKRAVQEAEISPDQVKGIGFDATCSLVVLGEDDKPVTISPSDEEEQNVIVWMDHRSKQEAEEINEKGHEVLKYVGGTISPEMETPKLLWLKRNKPETWDKATKFFDLPDFLVYKATGKDVRSVCSTTCKWTYLAHEDGGSSEGVGRWEDSYFNEIGLGDVADEEYSRIGQTIKPVGESVSSGLTSDAAEQMGLNTDTSVSVSIIDAHAGGLGLLAMDVDGVEKEDIDLESRMALIGGTSSCHMAVSEEPQFIKGVWGPYYSAMIPDMWLTEGGQSATGALVDHVIFSSDKSIELGKEAARENKTVYELLNDRLYVLKEENKLSDVGLLTKDLHVLPYFHGNRSPRANPSLRGSISGLKLSSTVDDLALKYLATIQAIAYGTRHIIETLNEEGYSINKIMATGGGTKNELFLKEHADICGCDIVLPEESEAVLLGSAVLGAVASGRYPSVLKAMRKMNTAGRTVHPTNGKITQFHNAKYKVFHKMHQDQLSYVEIMN